VKSQALRNAVAAGAEGYPFPTNLDRDQPVDGLAPSTQAELVMQALDEEWQPATLADALAAYSQRRRTDDI
jgi:ectoine hydroxylase-related dioxygenase (phytanoyl-CoA dioxygenase family)